MDRPTSEAVDQFKSARLKLARAFKHIEEFERLDQEYSAMEPIRFTVVDDSTINLRRVVARQCLPLPDEFRLVVGDAAHNLRTALDHATWAILSGFPIPEKPITFPIGDNHTKFLERISQVGITKTTPIIQEAFTKLNACPEGNFDLYFSHELDIFDKHRDLTPVVVNLVISRLQTYRLDPHALSVDFVQAKFPLGGPALFVWQIGPNSPPLETAQQKLQEAITEHPTVRTTMKSGPQGQTDIVSVVLRRLVATVGAAVNALESAIDNPTAQTP